MWGEVEYAPAKTTNDDGTVIMSPPPRRISLPVGEKHIVDEPPAAEPGHNVQVSRWDEMRRPLNQSLASTSRFQSKLKRVAALKDADKWVLVKTWIKEKRGYWDFYLAVYNFREDNPPTSPRCGLHQELRKTAQWLVHPVCCAHRSGKPHDSAMRDGLLLRQ